MAAGLGFKTFAVGEVLSAANVNGYLMQGVLVFTNATARDAAITSPQEGQFAFTKDNDSLWYYSGAAWVASGATGDIEGVTAGVGISGGGTSGTVTVTNSMATAIDAKGDLIVGTGADTFARLPAGTNTYTLVADSAEATGLKWAAPAGGGGANWTLLNSGGTNLTGSQTITVSGISGADKILVYVQGASSASGSSRIAVRLNTDTGSNYFGAGAQNTFASTYAAANFSRSDGTAEDRIYLGSQSTNAAEAMAGYALFSGCNAAGVKVFNAAGQGSGSGGQEGWTTGGYYNSATVISSISMFSGTGNFDAGKVFVFTSA
jgi:hypothetical protein